MLVPTYATDSASVCVELTGSMLTSQGRPHGWHRAVPVRGRMVTSAKERAYQQRLASMLWADRAKRCGRLAPLRGAVSVEVWCSYRRPKTGPNAKAPHCTAKPDLDNVVKSVLDAMQRGPCGKRGAGLIADDAQVVRLVSSKRWADGLPPSVVVAVWEVA